MARGLGWFSIALGVGELLGARSLARALGMRGSEGLIRSYGAREVLSGVLSLSIDKQAGLWSRVGGDAWISRRFTPDCATTIRNGTMSGRRSPWSSASQCWIFWLPMPSATGICAPKALIGTTAIAPAFRVASMLLGEERGETLPADETDKAIRL